MKKTKTYKEFYKCELEKHEKERRELLKKLEKENSITSEKAIKIDQKLQCVINKITCISLQQKAYEKQTKIGRLRNEANVIELELNELLEKINDLEVKHYE